ncbi:Ectoine hydroxylase-related dioxygenase, phytanoyl-CoA dioxygenase (PhyH) family [Micromonospora rhizosphaerae]|uniref:Ectoine hydroxylase-related dioxygenase, phytanoyl-CoA dioxygenase (PhyH) family n=1 Tax=Micromonospora rhizosphaerae TaxID=568872 RepID=A0A1C6SJZ6_9ACTN|nr:phytanoyl-CoA dioxygenase family protein [Micromonospora rhizosphaerae]SCL29727.1 Ectoine hydroxylase-related dioxygenase, phytanoyl-CoA dioxygenase (PhyH) family [Micromonospora rhizosphaerae]
MSNYDDDGYLILDNVLSPEALARVREEATAICRGLRGDIDGVQPAGSHEQDAEVLRRYLCIHFPHKISPLLHDVAVLPKVADALTGVIGPNVKMMQSMLFIKAEGKPGQAWHQDETHIPTRDQSLTAVWLALDDATVENGCLWVLPGSHRRRFLYPDRDQHDPRFDCTKEAHGFTDEDAIPVELPAGSALVFDGHLLHRSLPNTGRHGMRRAYVTHYMSADSLLPWFPPGPGESMATVDHRDIVVVAGEDPYAFKGITDVMRPHVRPAGEGGCVR